MLITGVRILGVGDLVDVEVDGAAIRSVTASRLDPYQAGDRVMLPGLVDLHTHLREPGGEESETIASGTAAAAAGGFTDVFAMPNTLPPTDTPERVRRLRALTARGASARVHVIGAATLGRAGRALVDVAGLRREGVRIFSDDGACLDDAALVAALLGATRRHGAVFAQHAQSAALAGDGVAHDRIAPALAVQGWPAEGEEVVIARDLGILAQVGGRLHVCHVSTRGAVQLIREAKAAGLAVTAEVTPHHLMLTDDDVLVAGAALKVNPPLRERQDVEALRAGLRDGTIDIVATDHAPHPQYAKTGPMAAAAFGLTGLESAASVVAEVLVDELGNPDWVAVAAVLAARPARIGGLPHVSELRPSDPATFCVIETRSTPWPSAVPRSKSANTPFPGRRFRSRLALTVLEGAVTYARDSGIAALGD